MVNFKRIYSILLPGLVFQSVIIAGGYGTGQEIAQFFVTLGPISGLLGVVFAGVLWSILCMLTFEYARITKSYDYLTFFKNLLGKAWVLFDFAYLLVIVIVLSIVSASIGSLGHELLGVSHNFAIILTSAYTLYTLMKGSKAIAKLLTFWSVFLYCVFLCFFGFYFARFGSSISSNFAESSFAWSWLKNGSSYASYNMGLVPATFFCLSKINTRKEALIAGALTGPIAIIPGILFFVCMVGQQEEILTVLLPSTYMFDILNLPLLKFLFSVALLGTLLETSIGLIHAFNRRIATQLADTNFTHTERIKFFGSALILLSSFALSKLGLVVLIVKGYDFLNWLMIFLLILPLLTRGLYTIVTTSKTSNAANT